MSYSRGYVALFSVLVVSALLSIATITAGTEVYLLKIDLAGEITYRKSRAAARSCAQRAVHALSIDLNRFDTALPIQFYLQNKDICRIVSSDTTSISVHVEVQGISDTSVSSLQVTATRPNTMTLFTITNWESTD